uniref:Barrier-to-autointegration factor-like protein n=1 Tax=Xenopsylla cheopis TaxID=163159 RepID=A0A6M2DF72_XENCH
MSTTQKHRNFVSEPMGNKLVTDLAGIGPTLGKRLADKGYYKASTVLGKFLALDKDEDKFKPWLKSVCGANSKQAGDCYHCLSEWCNIFL